MERRREIPRKYSILMSQYNTKKRSFDALSLFEVFIQSIKVLSAHRRPLFPDMGVAQIPSISGAKTSKDPPRSNFVSPKVKSFLSWSTAMQCEARKRRSALKIVTVAISHNEVPSFSCRFESSGEAEFLRSLGCMCFGMDLQLGDIFLL